MWHDLANAHAADEDYAAALPCCERIVALQPDGRRCHSDLGWALQEEGRLARPPPATAGAWSCNPTTWTRC